MQLKRHPNVSPFLLLPVFSGILAWVSFPKLSQAYFAWFALVPLLVYVARVQRSSAAFLGGAIAGGVQFLALLYWIPPVLSHYGGLPGISSWLLFLPMILVLSLYPGAACAVTRYCVNRGGIRFLLVFAPAWVTLEFARSVFPFGGFPWLLLGYSQTGWLRMMQVADLSGVYGVSFLIAWVNSALAYLLIPMPRVRAKITPQDHVAENARSAGAPRLRWIPIALGAAGIIGTAGYGEAALRKWDQVQANHRAALLQGNLSIDEPDSTLLAKYDQGYVAMADRLSSKIDLLVLPEAPSPIVYQNDEKYRHSMQQLARRYSLGMVFNNICFRDVGGQERYFNCAYFLDGNGSAAGRYDKIHLVPFGEYIPLQPIFFFSETISKDVGSFWPGSEYSTFSMLGHTVNTIICFEAVFPDLASQFVRNGSELIINLTNDAWYGDTSAPYQHLAMARWRAVENRRFLLRATNSGISAIVAPTGRLRAETRLLRPDVAVGDFAFLKGTTFYTRHGRVLIWLCAIITLLILLWSRRLAPLGHERTEAGND